MKLVDELAARAGYGAVIAKLEQVLASLDEYEARQAKPLGKAARWAEACSDSQNALEALEGHVNEALDVLGEDVVAGTPLDALMTAICNGLASLHDQLDEAEGLSRTTTASEPPFTIRRLS